MHRFALDGLRVLVAEDEFMISMLIEDLLSDHKCEIIGPFDRVKMALEAAQTETIDIAILDVNLAGVKIYPVADELAARKIPFILLSGYGKSAAPQDHPEWPVCNKPFRPEELLSMLEGEMSRLRTAG